MIRKFEANYGVWILRYRWLVILLMLIMVGLAASGGRFLSFTTNYRVFFSDDNPQLLAFEALEKTYSKNDNVMLVITPKDGNVFTPKTLAVIQELTEKSWQIPYSTRVDSITNFQHTFAEVDDLIVQDLVLEPDSLNQQGLDQIRAIALSEPTLVNRLISPNAHTTGINVTIQLPGNDVTRENPEVVHFVRKLADEMRQLYPDVDIRIVGMIMMNHAFTEASQNDMMSVVPISFLLMLVFLGILLRDVTSTIGTLLVIIFSILTALGLGGYIGYPITPPSAATPNIVLTVAIANSVHILVTFLHEMRRGLPKNDAIIESLRVNLQPVFLASFTTAIGFLSMNFSEVPPFMHLGNMVAIGVVASFIFSVTFLPVFMSLLPVRVGAHEDRNDTPMLRFAEFVVMRRRLLFWGMTGTMIILVSFITRNDLNDIFVHYFDEKIQFRQDVDYSSENLSGMYVIEYSVESGEPGGISNPGFLKDIAAFSEWYRQQPEVDHVNTFSDVMLRLNKNMHGDDPEWYRLPKQRDLAAQYLLLYEMSLPYGLDLNNQINIDKSSTRLIVTTIILSSNALIELEQRGIDWLKENTTHIKRADASGTTLMFAHIGKRNIITMIMGTTAALILISFLLILAFRSFKIGLVSMIPNLVPAAMGFGLWGMLVGEVGLGLSVVMGMTLGIVVDDTVHFLSKYLRARREKNLSSPDAVRYAFNNVGRALVVTSVVLVVGFLVLALSSFKLNSGMGMLTAIVIVFALAADFLFLPPLLMKLDKNANKA